MLVKKCPYCKSPYVYVGAIFVECGEKPDCPNWTVKQATAVTKMLKEKADIELDDYGLPLPNFESDDETDPFIPLPLFHSFQTD